MGHREPRSPRRHPGTIAPPAGFDWDFALALVAYTAASAADYLLTVAGLGAQEIRELNPFLNLYIARFGPDLGLAIPKLLLGFATVLPACVYIHAMYRRRRTRIRATYILYPAAILTVLAPLHWVLLRTWFGPTG